MRRDCGLLDKTIGGRVRGGDGLRRFWRLVGLGALAASRHELDPLPW